MSRIAVVLINLGGPMNLEEVEPFLANLFSDVIRFPWGSFGARALGRFIAKRRKAYAQGMYRQIGGGSPIVRETKAQAVALQEVLGNNYYVTYAMRYSTPMIGDTQRALAAEPDGWAKVVALPLFPQYSFATIRTCQQEWYANERLTGHMTLFVGSYHNHPDYIVSLRELLFKTLEGNEESDSIHVVFSAHSVPMSYIRKGDTYRSQIDATANLVMKGLPNPYSVAYQSKVGPVKWLGPAMNQHLAALVEAGIKQVVVVPISFVCEHMETLYELDILLREVAREAGISTYLRVPAPGVHPRFIAALADIVHHAERYSLS